MIAYPGILYTVKELCLYGRRERDQECVSVRNYDRKESFISWIDVSMYRWWIDHTDT
jgi:hypothetical protein